MLRLPWLVPAVFFVLHMQEESLMLHNKERKENIKKAITVEKREKRGR